MLPKSSRLTALQVRTILKNGRSKRLGTLSARYVAGSSTKAAVVVSSKVAKRAVDRNRLRRQAYEALAPLLPPRLHVVFFLHKAALDPKELTALCLTLS
jgi:ribonuclease P protein component